MPQLSTSWNNDGNAVNLTNLRIARSGLVQLLADDGSSATAVSARWKLVVRGATVSLLGTDAPGQPWTERLRFVPGEPGIVDAAKSLGMSHEDAVELLGAS